MIFLVEGQLAISNVGGSIVADNNYESLQALLTDESIYYRNSFAENLQQNQNNDDDY